MPSRKHRRLQRLQCSATQRTHLSTRVHRRVWSLPSPYSTTSVRVLARRTRAITRVHSSAAKSKTRVAYLCESKVIRSNNATFALSPQCAASVASPSQDHPSFRPTSVEPASDHTRRRLSHIKRTGRRLHRKLAVTAVGLHVVLSRVTFRFQTDRNSMLESEYTCNRK